MAMFSGLDGVKGGVLHGPIVRSVSAAMNTLKSERVVTGAGDYGAWTVWVTDDGAYKCDFSQYRVTKHEAVVGTKAQVKAWLKEFVPKCHAPNEQSSGESEGRRL